MSDEDTIISQQRLLRQHRDTLQIYLEQVARSGWDHMPPSTVNAIREIRDQIKQIKQFLRQVGVSVEDYPNDAEYIETNFKPKTENSKDLSAKNPKLSITFRLSIAGAVISIAFACITAQLFLQPHITGSISIRSTFLDHPITSVALNNPSITKPTPVPPLPTAIYDMVVQVSGREGWQSTGVYVLDGERFDVTYLTGTWAGRVGFGPNLPDIWTDAGGTDQIITFSEYPELEARFGSLIGKIGNGKAFRVGKSYSSTSITKGFLYLRMHDNDMIDNDGSITVRIRVYP